MKIQKHFFVEALNQSEKFLKQFTQDQIDQLAEISPNCDLQNNRWGDYSIWILSKAGKAIKYGKKTFEQIMNFKDQIRLDIEAFDQHKKDLNVTSIDTYKSFAELHDAVKNFIDNGKVIPRTVTSKMSNRARTAYQRMKSKGMEIVYETNDWLVSVPLDYETNETMSAIGKWCHTGDMTYWKTYTSAGPLYYILNKRYEFCLCMSYWREKEIRNQFDFQPQKKSIDSNDWELYVDGKTIKKDHALEYDNSDNQWEVFFDWLDPKGDLKNSILNYEKRYEEELKKKYQQLAFAEISSTFSNMNLANGVLRIGKGDAQKLHSLFNAKGLEIEPDEEDFEDEDEYEMEAQRVDEENELKINEYKTFMVPQIEKFIKENIKVIKPTKDFTVQVGYQNGRYHLYLFSGILYDKFIPTFDMEEVENADNFFLGCKLKVFPKIINTQNIKSAKFMFANCKNIEKIDTLNLDSCTNIDSMFKNSSIKNIGELSLQNCINGKEIFSSDVHIQKLHIPNVRNVFRFFGLCGNYGYPPKITVDELDFDHNFMGKIQIGDPYYNENAVSKQDVETLAELDSEILNKILIESIPEYVKTLEMDKDGFIIYNKNLLLPFITIESSGISLVQLKDEEQASVLEKDLSMFKDQNVKVTQKSYLDNFSHNLLNNLAYGIHQKYYREFDFTGKIFILKDNGTIEQVTKEEMRSKLFKMQNPEGLMKIMTDKDAHDFKKKAYDDGLLDEISMVDIREWWTNAMQEMNLWLFIWNVVPTDAKDIPYIKVTQKQYDYVQDEKHAVQIGDDDYDIDYEIIDLFEHHPNLAKKYGKYGYKCKKFIVQDKLNESIKIKSFKQFYLESK